MTLVARVVTIFLYADHLDILKNAPGTVSSPKK